MDNHITALKRSSRMNGVIGEASRVVNSERKLFVACSVLPAVSYLCREGVAACGEE